uniref:Uncharacterized protein n=1 Tax=Knipowitschia caucasica TaxID=637954 RepID=A0AAV2MDS4_KNICA
MDPFVHYATRELPLAAKRPALGHDIYCSGQDWSWTGYRGFSPHGPAALRIRGARHQTSPSLRAGQDVLPRLDRYYANAAQVVTLAINMTFITGALDRALSSGQALSGDLPSQARTTSAAFLRMCQTLAVDGGQDTEDSVRMALQPSAFVWPDTRPLLPSERDRMSWRCRIDVMPLQHRPSH